MQVEGTVAGGLGEGASYVALYTDTFAKKLGIRPVVGTLNLKTSKAVLQKLRNSDKKIVVEPPAADLHPVHVLPADVQGFDAFVVLPMKTQHKAVVELISETHLRSTLKLKDGQKLKVVVLG